MACVVPVWLQGTLAQAVKKGHWILLDEINLAAAETLECLSGLLEGSAGSLVLLDRGDTGEICDDRWWKSQMKRVSPVMVFWCFLTNITVELIITTAKRWEAQICVKSQTHWTIYVSYLSSLFHHRAAGSAPRLPSLCLHESSHWCREEEPSSGPQEQVRSSFPHVRLIR